VWCDVQATTPAGIRAFDSPNDRHGDIDRNGDLVDELAQRIRLASAITAATPQLAGNQLDAVQRLLRLRGVRS
jgi:hypothetical protein